MFGKVILSKVQRFVQRWVPWFLIDAVLVVVSFWLALFLRLAARIPEYYMRTLPVSALFIVIVYYLVNRLFGVYRRVWEYASAQEEISIIASVVTSTSLLCVLDLLLHVHPLPLSVVYLGGVFTLTAFTAVRYRTRLLPGLVRRWRALWGYWPEPGKRVLIVGAGEAGQLLAWQLLNHEIAGGYRVMGFIDDDPDKVGMQIHGAEILGDRQSIPAIVRREEIDLIIISDTMSSQDFQDTLNICLDTTAQVKVPPTVLEVIEGRGSLLPFRDITPEDLLGRKSFRIDHEACRRLLADKVVMVTGACG